MIPLNVCQPANFFMGNEAPTKKKVSVFSVLDPNMAK